jgi:small subunit ribosomal protein S8
MNNLLYDMLTRIRNGQQARKLSILQPKFKNCVKLLNILEEEGYILGYKISKVYPKMFEVFLKYKSEKPVINKIIIISKPSKRIYISIKEVWKLSPGFGLAILFTKRGVLPHRKACRFNVGGEIFCVLK